MTQTPISPLSLYPGATLVAGAETLVIERVRFYMQTNVSMARVFVAGRSMPVLVRVTEE